MPDYYPELNDEFPEWWTEDDYFEHELDEVETTPRQDLIEGIINSVRGEIFSDYRRDYSELEPLRKKLVKMNTPTLRRYYKRHMYGLDHWSEEELRLNNCKCF